MVTIDNDQRLRLKIAIENCIDGLKILFNNCNLCTYKDYRIQRTIASFFSKIQV